MSSEPRLVLVVARAENGVIGKDGGMPWRLSSDLKRFRQLTIGKPVIMGRKTFESIGKALDGRDNIVVSRNPAFDAEGIVLARSFDEALSIARRCASKRGAEEIAVIGGAQIYDLALERAETIELTEVHATPEGDTFFPEPDKAAWREVYRERHGAGERDSADYSFVTYRRRRGGQS